MDRIQAHTPRLLNRANSKWSQLFIPFKVFGHARHPFKVNNDFVMPVTAPVKTPDEDMSNTSYVEATKNVSNTSSVDAPYKNVSNTSTISCKDVSNTSSVDSPYKNVSNTSTISLILDVSNTNSVDAPKNVSNTSSVDAPYKNVFNSSTISCKDVSNSVDAPSLWDAPYKNVSNTSTISCKDVSNSSDVDAPDKDAFIVRQFRCNAFNRKYDGKTYHEIIKDIWSRWGNSLRLPGREGMIDCVPNINRHKPIEYEMFFKNGIKAISWWVEEFKRELQPWGGHYRFLYNATWFDGPKNSRDHEYM